MKIKLEGSEYSVAELVDDVFGSRLKIDLSQKVSDSQTLRRYIRSTINRSLTEKLKASPSFILPGEKKDIPYYSKDDCLKALDMSKKQISNKIKKTHEVNRRREYEERLAIGKAYAEENYRVEKEYYTSGQHDEFEEEMQAKEWAKDIAKLLHDLRSAHLHGLNIIGGKKVYDSKTGKVLCYEEVRQRVDRSIEDRKNPTLWRSALEEATNDIYGIISPSELEKMWQDYLGELVKKYVLEQMDLDFENLRKVWEEDVHWRNHRQPLDKPDDLPAYDMKMLEDPLKNFKLKE